MMAKSKYGGYSIPWGIFFSNNKYNVYVNMKTGKSEVKKNAAVPKIYNKFRKIPFIRGIMFFYSLFHPLVNALKPLNLGLLIMVIALIKFYRLFNPTFLMASSNPSLSLIWDVFIDTLLLGFIFFVFFARRNHSVEHKVLAAYQKNRNLSLENIWEQPKENRLCGSVFVAWYFILFGLLRVLSQNIISDSFSWSNLIIFLFFWSIAYETAMLSGKNNGTCSNIAYAPGWLLQKFSTSDAYNPDDVLKARNGFIQLLKKQNRKYAM